MKIDGARLLLVTDPRPDLVARVEAAVRGGVDIVQLRDKRAPVEGLIPLAEELKDVCERAGALFTVNDDVELARRVGADGVHLGEDDDPTPRARSVLGTGAVVGRSAGGVAEALEAVRGGADYLGVGAVYATPTKPEGEVAGLETIRALSRENLQVPWFAIGGVTLETAPHVAEAGAPGFAVVRAVLDAEDPEGAARALRVILE
ncbi:thiamine phosphate synthase [Rubrobacter tropicus]|uniref:thiamine phosphate synthase n=1 Tax=Rubrobacter tropicus TaxID=2653851 RepID=UPI001A9F5C3E|nr:thiamine phosphate synthase [Rubrobacter tropicus]